MKIYLCYYFIYVFMKIFFIFVKKKKDDIKDILFFLIVWVIEISKIKDVIYG